MPYPQQSIFNYHCVFCYDLGKKKQLNIYLILDIVYHGLIYWWLTKNMWNPKIALVDILKIVLSNMYKRNGRFFFLIYVGLIANSRVVC